MHAVGPAQFAQRRIDRQPKRAIREGLRATISLVIRTMRESSISGAKGIWIRKARDAALLQVVDELP